MKFLAILLLLPFSALAEGSQTYELNPFNEIRISGPMRAKIIKSDVHKVVIHSDKEINFEDFEVTVKGGDLKIDVKSNDYKDRAPDVEIYVKTISEIRAIGNAGVHYDKSDEVIEEKEIKLSATAGGHIHIQLKSEFVEASITSGGNITLAGETGTLEAKVTSGGTIGASHMTADRVVARTKAGGTIYVHAIKELDAKTNAGGNIKYIGDPEEVTTGGLGGTIEKVEGPKKVD